MEDKAEHLNFNFDNSFFNDLEDFFVPCKACPSSSPKILQFNSSLAKELGLNPDLLDSKEGLGIFSGNVLPQDSKPLSQAYSGHQFGGFSPLLGDGRALLLGEILDPNNKRWDIQLKGSGRTPFSRGGDGRSALGPVLREYLISESMHYLGIPTTRALAAIATGNVVNREGPFPGGILTRVAQSHIRIGTFQFATALGGKDKIKKITDYSIKRHYPEVIDSENPYLDFFKEVSKAQASLVARWMSVGFIHGVMNTDNTTISGETIDYGPCAFMDTYSPETVFSSIDTKGRYAYCNQSKILSWNLTRLAETMIPLVHENQDKAVSLLTTSIENISHLYDEYWLNYMRSKIGLSGKDSTDKELINDLLYAMEDAKVDFTSVFRNLAKVLQNDGSEIIRLFSKSFLLDAWLIRWRDRLAKDGKSEGSVIENMNKINPIYIPRNYKVEEVLKAAVSHQDIKPFSDFLSVLKNPFEEVTGNESYAGTGPVSSSPYKTFCGT